MFGAAAFYGKVTNKDLSSWGTFLLMGLVGLIIAGIVNIFIGNSMLEFFISLIGIVIFIGLTAYDVYKIKNYANDYPYIQDNSAEKISVFFALQLYLDFINIFLKLLRFMGKRKN
jgi:FtsH-binding integral membrane protein